MSTAQDEIIRLAEAKMKDDAMTFRDALMLVSRENPVLASEYRSEVLKSPTVFEPPPTKDEFSPSHAASELTRLARDKAQSDGVPFGDALAAVCRQSPQLASEYRKEVTKSKA